MRSSLHDRLAQRRQAAVNQASDALQEMASLAEGLRLQGAAADFTDARKNLLADSFRVLIVGRFNNGKSTLLNALLGVPAPGSESRGILPVGRMPTTALVTQVRFSEEPNVRAWRASDRKPESWTFERFLEHGGITGPDGEANSGLEELRVFDVGVPIPLLKAGVSFVDTPGLDEAPLRQQQTLDAVRHADAALVVYRSDALAGLEERRLVEEHLTQAGVRTMTVVNMWGDEPPDGDLVDWVWKRTGHTGPAPLPLDLPQHDIFLVNAFDALEARLNGEPDDVARSGLKVLEDRLAAFFVHDRHAVHTERFLTFARATAEEVEHRVEQRLATLEQEVNDAATAVESARTTPDRSKDPRRRVRDILEGGENECVSLVAASFDRMLVELEGALERALEERPIPSMRSDSGLPGAMASLSAAVRKKQIRREVISVCEEVTGQHVQAWQQEVAERDIPRVLDRVIDDVANEVAVIERELQDWQIRLSGWTAPRVSGDTRQSQFRRRLASGLAAVGGVALTGGVAAIPVLVSSLGGVRSVAGAVAGTVASQLVLGTLGVASGGLLLPVAAASSAVAGALTGGSVGLEKRIKGEVLDQYGKALREAAPSARRDIQTSVQRALMPFTHAVYSRAEALIEEEEQAHEATLDLLRTTRSEKEDAKTRLLGSRKRLGELLTALDDALVMSGSHLTNTPAEQP